jgi:hypothetical protein
MLARLLSLVLIAVTLSPAARAMDCSSAETSVTYPCDQKVFETCLKDLKTAICPKGDADCDQMDLYMAQNSCACNSVLNPADRKGPDGCLIAMTPAHFKEAYSGPYKNRHCDAILPFPCDQQAYAACFKDLEATFCPKGEANCEYLVRNGSIVELQMPCVCASLSDKTPGSKSAEFCQHTDSPAEAKKKFVSQPPLYCDGYVQSPCNEDKYRACMLDLGTTFCPNGSGCEGIGPALAVTCACENLLDKTSMSSETFCKDHMTPRQLKKEMLKEMHK